MHIVKWFVQKIKQSVPVTDESRYDEWAKEQRLIERRNEEERLKSLSKQDVKDEAWLKKYPRRIEPICNDCGMYVSDCLCEWRKSDQEG